MDDVALDVTTLRATWPQVRDWSLAPMTRDANNVTARVESTLWRDEWLRANADRLMEMAVG